MPEYRSQTIGPEAGANVSARYDDRAAGIVLAQASRNAQADANGWKQFNEGLQAFLHSGNKLYNEYRDKTSKAYIQESLLRAREEMEAWRTEYDKTHKGQSGLQAAADYQQQWAKISEAHMKGLRDQGVSGPYEQLANLHLRENGLHYNSQGVQFQQQQDKAWNTSIYEGQKDEMVRAVQNDPDNAAWHGFLKSGVLDAYRRLHPGEDTSKLEHELDNLIATNRIDTKIAAKDFEGAERDLAVYGNAGGLNGVPTHTGQARVLAKYESGTQGSMHVSYGLPRTDGVDVGKYSFITKGGNGGSVGEFIRWAGQQGGIGKELYDKMHALTGGDWNALDSREFWKSKGGQAAWQALVKSDPAAFEQLEDGFWLPRLNSQIGKLRPEVQEAIRNDQTGALREMALSTINQHKTALRILNDNFDADPETFVKNVYKDRSSPSRFAATGDAGIGARRMRGEVRDVLAILHGGAQQNDAAGRQPEGQQPGRAGAGWLTPSDMLRIRHQLDAARELQRKEQADATAQHIVSVTASFPPAQQEAEAYRLMEALPPDVRAKVKPLVDGGLKFRKDALDAQYGANMAEALELFPKMAPAEREQSIDAMERGKKISPEMADKLRTWNNKEASKITPERQKTFDNLLASMNRRIALGVKDALTDTSEIDREFARGNLTQKQREELVKIQRNSGALKNFDKPHLDSLYQKIIGKKDVEMPGEMYSRLFRMAMDAGKPLDDDAIQTLIARELTSVTTPGRFWGTNEIPLWEAESSEAGSNKAKVIGIPVPQHLEQYVTDEMRARGFTEAQMNDQKTREQFYANTFYGRK